MASSSTVGAASPQTHRDHASQHITTATHFVMIEDCAVVSGGERKQQQQQEPMFLDLLPGENWLHWNERQQSHGHENCAGARMTSLASSASSSSKQQASAVPCWSKVLPPDRFVDENGAVAYLCFDVDGEVATVKDARFPSRALSSSNTATCSSAWVPFLCQEDSKKKRVKILPRTMKVLQDEDSIELMDQDESNRILWVRYRRVLTSEYDSTRMSMRSGMSGDRESGAMGEEICCDPTSSAKQRDESRQALLAPDENNNQYSSSSFYDLANDMNAETQSFVERHDSSSKVLHPLTIGQNNNVVLSVVAKPEAAAKEELSQLRTTMEAPDKDAEMMHSSAALCEKSDDDSSATASFSDLHSQADVEASTQLQGKPEFEQSSQLQGESSATQRDLLTQVQIESQRNLFDLEKTKPVEYVNIANYSDTVNDGADDALREAEPQPKKEFDCGKHSPSVKDDIVQSSLDASMENCSDKEPQLLKDTECSEQGPAIPNDAAVQPISNVSVDNMDYETLVTPTKGFGVRQKDILSPDLLNDDDSSEDGETDARDQSNVAIDEASPSTHEDEAVVDDYGSKADREGAMKKPVDDRVSERKETADPTSQRINESLSNEYHDKSSDREETPAYSENVHVSSTAQSKAMHDDCGRKADTEGTMKEKIGDGSSDTKGTPACSDSKATSPMDKSKAVHDKPTSHEDEATGDGDCKSKEQSLDSMREQVEYESSDRAETPYSDAVSPMEQSKVVYVKLTSTEGEAGVGDWNVKADSGDATDERVDDGWFDRKETHACTEPGTICPTDQTKALHDKSASHEDEAVRVGFESKADLEGAMKEQVDEGSSKRKETPERSDLDPVCPTKHALNVGLRNRRVDEINTIIKNSNSVGKKILLTTGSKDERASIEFESCDAQLDSVEVEMAREKELIVVKFPLPTSTIDSGQASDLMLLQRDGRDPPKSTEKQIEPEKMRFQNKLHSFSDLLDEGADESALPKRPLGSTSDGSPAINTEADSPQRKDKQIEPKEHSVVQQGRSSRSSKLNSAAHNLASDKQTETTTTTTGQKNKEQTCSADSPTQGSADEGVSPHQLLQSNDPAPANHGLEKQAEADFTEPANAIAKKTDLPVRPTRSSRKRKPTLDSSLPREPTIPSKRQRSLPTRRNVGTNPVTDGSGILRVLVTGFELQKEQLAMVEKLGGELIRNLKSAQTASHVIISNGVADIRRTPKLMIALCRTANVVKIDWLVKSAARGKALPVQNFLLLNDRKLEKKYEFSMSKTLNNLRCSLEQDKLLLDGWCFYIAQGVAGNKAPPKDEMQLIIQGGGGTWLPSLSSSKIDFESVVIITSDPEVAKQLSPKAVAAALELGAKKRTTAWLFQCIMRQEIDL